MNLGPSYSNGLEKKVANGYTDDGFDCCLVGSFLSKSFWKFGMHYSLRIQIFSLWTISVLLCFYGFDGNVSICERI